MSKKDKVPRIVLTLTDTQTLVPGPNGEQYYSVNVAAESLVEFNKLLPEDDQKDGKTELERVFRFFQQAIDDLSAVKDTSIDKTK
jgi:hypothetical protein